MAVTRLYYLPLGELDVDQRRLPLGIRAAGDWVTTPINAYLIQTDRGENILFDTGCDPDGLADPERVWGRLSKALRFRVGPEDSVISRLAQVGLTPDDITHVVASHLHFDHAGGLRLFPKAEIVIQRAEYRYALYPSEAFSGFFRSDFDYPSLHWRLIDGDELLTPGALLLLTNGHTPGCQSLLVNLPETGPMLLASDACYFVEHLERNRPAPGAWNSQLAYEAIRRLKGLGAWTGAPVICGHDVQQLRTLKRAPEYYA